MVYSLLENEDGRVPLFLIAQLAVSRIETGRSGLEIVMNAAAALGIPLDAVIEWSENPLL